MSSSVGFRVRHSPSVYLEQKATFEMAEIKILLRSAHFCTMKKIRGKKKLATEQGMVKLKFHG